MAEEMVTQDLAHFQAHCAVDDVPEAVRHEGKRSLLNFFATALAGHRDPFIGQALAALQPMAGPPQATVIGNGARLDALNVAFLNGASANAHEFDDTHFPTVIHPTAPVAGALFAWAEHRPTSGAALLHAFVLGVDATCRIGNAVSPSHYRRGWHITATCGVFGAAAAIAKLHGFDETRTAWALGNASVQSSSLVESLGSASKSIGVGNAARNGMMAAMMAAAGVDGADRAIEGPRGFIPVTSESQDPGAVTRDLGTVWEIQHNTYKPYPCGVVLFPVIDGCLALRGRIAAAQIARVTVAGHVLLGERTDRPGVTNGREAKVSLQHSVAVAFLHGAAGLAQYEDACVADPPVRALAAKVAYRHDPGIAVEGCEITIETTDGKTVTERVPHWRGSLENPLSDGDLEAKLRTLAAEAAPWCDAGRLIEAVWTLDRAADAGALVRLTVPRVG
jgi:2-methylcitrate dehydratase PrpD